MYSGPIHVEGRPLLYSIIHDVTDRRRAEEALKESESRYRGLFENMNEVVTLRRFIYDESGELVDTILINANPPGPQGPRGKLYR